MTTTPNNASQYIFGPAGQGDILHFADSTGAVVSWIDGNGLPQGNLSSGAVQFPGAPIGTCSAGQSAVNTGTGDFYSCSSGSWTKVGPTASSLSSPVSSPSPLAFDVNVNFKGPNPYADVTRYGVRSTTATVAPSVPGITVTVNSGSTAATLSSASTFQNGDGVVIFGAGAAHAMTTPGTLTATPSLSAGPAVTGTVANGPTGATTYNYKVIARNTSQGLTAASSVVTTTTGAATLGYNTVGITSQSRSGAITTVTTSSAHGLATGAVVNIFQATDGAEFSGWFVVSGSADNTHFTYTNGIDTGAPVSSTSSTGGTVSWFSCNRVAWAAVTGAFQYFIYSDRANPGTYALVGISEPGILFWDDYGSPMMDGLLFPYYVPTTPPSSATSNSLSTTISSGAGTTSLTLAASAGTSVSGATILFDNTPNLTTAVTANAGGALVYFPAGGTYVFNSFFSGSASFSLGGQLYLNDTMQISGKFTGGLTPAVFAGPSFSFEGENVITVGRAFPGLYSAAFNSSTLSHLQFQMVGRAGRAVIFQGSINGNYEWLVCQLNANDLTGVPITLHNVKADVFFNTFRNCTLTAPQGQNSSAPVLALVNVAGGDGIGITQIENTSLSGRTIHSDAIEFYFIGGRCQAGNAPVIMQTSASKMRIENFDQDTMAHPLVACYASGSSLFTQNAGSPSFDGVSAPPLISGVPFAGITGANISSSGQNINIGSFGGSGGLSASNYGGVKITNTTAATNAGQGTSASIGYLMTTAPPTLSISGGTGPAANTYYYGLEAVDALGNATVPSAPSASITVNGSQGILVTFPAAQPGQVSWNICRTTNLGQGFTCAQGGNAAGGFQVSVSNATYLDANAYTGTNSPNTGNLAATAWVAKNGVGGQSLLLTNTPFASLPSPVKNGEILYCADCTFGSNPCTGSGSGAYPKGLNGSWICT